MIDHWSYQENTWVLASFIWSTMEATTNWYSAISVQSIHHTFSGIIYLQKNWLFFTIAWHCLTILRVFATIGAAPKLFWALTTSNIWKFNFKSIPGRNGVLQQVYYWAFCVLFITYPYFSNCSSPYTVVYDPNWCESAHFLLRTVTFFGGVLLKIWESADVTNSQTKWCPELQRLTR